MALAAMLLGAMFGGSVNAAYAASTICVPDDYLTIQAALSASSSGDIVIVKKGSHLPRFIA